MKCHVCGSGMQQTVTDLPFKTGDNSIVIIKGVPVIQCQRCREYLLEDSVLERVEELLSKVNKAAELEIVRYAA